MTSEFNSSILEELAWRGRIEQQTHDTLDEELAKASMTLYCGFDPTSDSLTAGNLVPMMGLAFFLRHGHQPIALLGGATGRIGDPSFRSEERKLRTVDEIEADAQAIGRQLQKVLENSLEMHPETLSNCASGDVEIGYVNNADWTLPWSYIDFLREIGKHFRVNTMLAKDSVRTRLEGREQGISYTEFSYVLLQAYDFLNLYQTRGCRLQIGGSDQWGNITAGIDLTRRKAGATVYGLTMPLLTTSNGEKMGKSEKGALWLDGGKTSPYEWYQYWVQSDDADAGKLLKTFTFLPRETVEDLEREVDEGRNHGQVQRTLAFELTELIHGKAQADKAVRASKMLFGGKIGDLEDRDLATIFKDVPSVTLPRAALSADGFEILDLFVRADLAQSKGAARRLISQGGGYINNDRTAVDVTVREEHLASETMMVLRAGKKNYRLVRFE